MLPLKLKVFNLSMFKENHWSPLNNSSDIDMRKNKLDIKELGLEHLEFLSKIRERFPKAQIYIVGGAVRDFSMGRSSKDLDFVVRNVAAEDLEEFLKTLGAINLVGRNFGVFKFVPSGGDSHNPIDIALPRTEYAFGTGGYHDFDVQSGATLPIEKDLSRRDFTINAMALDITRPNKLAVVDPFGGLKDLSGRLIKAVGQPEDRFKEDYSRMLRAIRFACQLGFTIEKQTYQAIADNIAHLNDLKQNIELISEGSRMESEVVSERIMPYEVMAKEFLKSFLSEPVKAFDLYDQLGVFAQLIPELLTMKKCPQPENFHSEGDVWQHTRLALEKLESLKFKKQFGKEPISVSLILAVLFHDLGKPSTIKTPEQDGTDRIRFNEHDIIGAKMARAVFNRLKLSSPEGIGIDIEKVVWLIQHHMLMVQGDIDLMRESTIEKYFFNPDYPGEDLLKLAWVDISATVPAKGQPNFTSFNQMMNRIKKLKSLSTGREELPPALLDGHDIMNLLGLKPGPKVGQIKEVLREKQLSGKIKTRDGAVEFVRQKFAR